jgi:hypothetical protein
MRQGHHTGTFGSQLAARLRASADHAEWIVFYDHGDTTVDSSVAATKGFFGDRVANLNRLADIDVLIASPDRVARILIEIEERACSPKKMLGDVLAALLCNRFAVRVQGRQELFEVASSTKLIVAGVVPTRGHRLQKISEVITPRLHQLSGLSDGISPRNVEFVFTDSIEGTITKLERMTLEDFGSAA